MVKCLLRALLNGVGLTVAAPFLLWSFVGLRLFRTERLYIEASYALAVAPGFLGMAVRRAYYRFALVESHWDLGIDFGSVITHPTSRLGKNIYIGSYTLIGRSRIGDGVRIGSRVSILSGRYQHRFHDQDLMKFEEEVSFRETQVGANTWIGEGAIVMADVGPSCGIGAGSVVVKPVLQGTIVAGNPARPISMRNV